MELARIDERLTAYKHNAAVHIHLLMHHQSFPYDVNWIAQRTSDLLASASEECDRIEARLGKLERKVQRKWVSEHRRTCNKLPDALSWREMSQLTECYTSFNKWYYRPLMQKVTCRF